MSLTRRDVIKAGVFAGAAMSLPLSRVVSGQSALDSRMAASKLPKPFTTPFAYPPVAVPVRSDDTTDYYALHMQPIQVEIVPGYQTLMFGYEGSVPGPTIKVHRGPQDGGAPLQPAAGHAPDVWLPAVHVGAPARLGLAAAVRRLRERHHQPESVQGLPLSELARGANALVPRPWRAPHRRERVPRAWSGSITSRTTSSSRCRSRRATTTCR